MLDEDWFQQIKNNLIQNLKDLKWWYAPIVVGKKEPPNKLNKPRLTQLEDIISLRWVLISSR